MTRDQFASDEALLGSRDFFWDAVQRFGREWTHRSRQLKAVLRRPIYNVSSGPFCRGVRYRFAVSVMSWRQMPRIW